MKTNTKKLYIYKQKELSLSSLEGDLSKTIKLLQDYQKKGYNALFLEGEWSLEHNCSGNSYDTIRLQGCRKETDKEYKSRLKAEKDYAEKEKKASSSTKGKHWWGRANKLASKRKLTVA